MARAALVDAVRARQQRVLLAAVGAASLVGGSGCLAPVQQAVQVWAVDGREYLAADTPAALENRIFSASARTIDLTAALNETVGFQVGLRSERPPAGPFVVEISDLSDGVNRLPARSVVSPHPR